MQIFVPGPAGHQAREFTGPVRIDPSGGLFPIELFPIEDGPAGPAEPAAWIWPFSPAPGKQSAVLFTRSSGLLVNGTSPLPMAVLRRGDEIRLNGVSLFFTDESPLRVEAFVPPAGADAPPAGCARCHGPIRPGDPVVRCPVCGLLYMAQPEKRSGCWAAGPCISCGRDPSVEFAWRPPEGAPAGRWASRPWRKSGASAPNPAGAAP